jgi:hypothetical protein
MIELWTRAEFPVYWRVFPVDCPFPEGSEPVLQTKYWEVRQANISQVSILC